MSINLRHPDQIEAVLRFSDGEHTFGIAVDARPPITLLLADEEMEGRLRPWKAVYREVMKRCGELLRTSREALAAK